MMSSILWRLCSLLIVFSSALADLYLHNPRGGNNRLNEKSATRRNPNRLFDSQNNNRGGYNVGDATSSPFGNNADKQYHMAYFQSGPSSKGKTYLTVGWTNQHGCGGNENTSPQKQNCALVLQYMCQDDTRTVVADTLRNGVQTNTQDYTKPNKNNAGVDRSNQNAKTARGLHEPWSWYNKCYLRERNKGLFVADQKLKSNNGLGYSSAIYTRQNPNGNRYGYECPEERDYFPYWHPTPWIDIAILAENKTMCSHYTSKSFNNQPYGECIESKKWSQYNNKAACEENGGNWVNFYNYLEKKTDKSNKQSCEKMGPSYKWGIPFDSKNQQAECLVVPATPECKEAPWSRSNHLGNGKDGVPLNYTWVLPYFPSGNKKSCVLRFRYNISTDDYDPYNTDYKQNDKFPEKPPIVQNPYVYIMRQQSPLRLAINTAQYGRVFQDRSHVFKLMPRPKELEEGSIFNLNIRGKRGNIVQVYPAVEYDFTPNDLQIKKNDFVHIQWTGSNTHNNGNPAGDGQAGSAGEGKAGTDRNNMVELTDRASNFPTPFEKSKLWAGVEVAWIYHDKKDIAKKDLAINLASSGYYRCENKTTCPESKHSQYLVSTKTKMNNLLDNASPSYEGVLLKYTKKGIYNYMCTRNNNFTNRSQKAAIIVK